MLIAIVVPFVLTLVVGGRQLTTSERGLVLADAQAAEGVEGAAAEGAVPTASAIAGSLVAPLSGAVKPIDEMPDPVFSSKCMGDGLCIEPAADACEVVAPADAEVAVTMPASNHAVGLRLANGMELLIHVGIDTVDMGGDGFACHVAQGDRVKAGQRLLTFDQAKIRAAGHPAVTAFVVSAPGQARDISFASGMDAVAGETAVVEFTA